jgi:hypothetical protein
MMGERTGRARPHGAGVQVTAMMLTLLVSVALMVAGCGDDDSDASANANDAYANSVCTAIGTWEQQVKSIATNLSGGISKASLQAAVTQAETATKTLATQIAAVPPPDTSDGQAAKQQLDQLSSGVTTTVDSAKSTAAQIPSNASAGAIAGALAGLAPQVKSLATTAQSTLSSLQNAGGSLASAFKNSSSCQSLGG